MSPSDRLCMARVRVAALMAELSAGGTITRRRLTRALAPIWDPAGWPPAGIPRRDDVAIGASLARGCDGPKL